MAFGSQKSQVCERIIRSTLAYKKVNVLAAHRLPTSKQEISSLQSENACVLLSRGFTAQSYVVPCVTWYTFRLSDHHIAFAAVFFFINLSSVSFAES